LSARAKARAANSGGDFCQYGRHVPVRPRLKVSALSGPTSFEVR
jgi:hypothetical protein